LPFYNKEIDRPGSEEQATGEYVSISEINILDDKWGEESQ